MTTPVPYRLPALWPWAETPRRLGGQLLGDLLVIVWCLFWWRQADDVRERVLGLQSAGQRAVDAGTGISDRLRSAGDAIDGVPFAGGPLASPLRSAADASDGLADAGRSAQEAVRTVATVVHVTMLVVLVGLVLLWWLSRRVRWTRSAGTGRRLRNTAEGLQVLGLRAAATAPLREVAAALPGGAGVDARTLEALGVLELQRLGLRRAQFARRVQP